MVGEGADGGPSDNKYNLPDNKYNLPDNKYNLPDNKYNLPDNKLNKDVEADAEEKFARSGMHNGLSSRKELEDDVVIYRPAPPLAWLPVSQASLPAPKGKHYLLELKTGIGLRHWLKRVQQQFE